MPVCPAGSQMNLRESGDLRSQGQYMCSSCTDSTYKTDDICFFSCKTAVVQCLNIILMCPLVSSCHLPGYQKASEPRAVGRGWDLRGGVRRDPAEVVLALREAALGCGCQVHHAGPFLLSCTHGVAGGRVAFEAEVCHLSTGTSETSNGVRYTRLWGAPLAFRDIATQISKDLELWTEGVFVYQCVFLCEWVLMCVRKGRGVEIIAEKKKKEKKLAKKGRGAGPERKDFSFCLFHDYPTCTHTHTQTHTQTHTHRYMHTWPVKVTKLKHPPSTQSPHPAQPSSSLSNCTHWTWIRRNLVEYFLLLL